MNLKLRLHNDDKAYQTHKATHSEDTMLTDWQNRIVEEFTHWVIIKNNFPWTRIAKRHHMLIPKRRFARAQDMTPEEEAEWKMIRAHIGKTYDMFIENLTGTLQDIYHPHLINLLEETDQAYYEIEEQAKQLRS